MTSTEPRVLSIEVTVEFEDVDSYGIAHHSRLVAYLERARVRLFTSQGVDLGRQRVVPVLYDLRVRYLRPALMLDRLEVQVFVKEITDYKLVLGYRVRRGSETLVRAATELAFSDLQGEGLVPVPQEYVRALDPYVGPGADPDGAGAGPDGA